MQGGEQPKVSIGITLFAIFSCVFQLAWFGSKCIKQIDFDGLAYTSIAQRLCRGQFHSAINAFHSPLISWLIAAGSLGRFNLLYVGKFVSIASFLLTVMLLYVFAKRLWRSEIVASVAILLYAYCRGLSPVAVEFVTPDYLFSVLVLVYFIVLIRCLGEDRARDWICLGMIHGLAFFTKTFALPWLALCSLISVLLLEKPLKVKASRLAAAAFIPVLVAAGWATILHSKYGVFTTGSQFKTNLLQWTLRVHPEQTDAAYKLLKDTSVEVDDPMPPGSWQWTYPVSIRRAFPSILLAESRNLPRLMKEMIIVITPGGLIAFIATALIVTKRKVLYSLESKLVLVIFAGAVSLCLAYSMLVFDERYLYPLIPLVLAVGARFLVADVRLNHSLLRRGSIALAMIGAIASIVYPHSPFRTLTRDSEIACYDAGNHLKKHRASELVSIGAGPFPDHGVGWEAGYKAAFFGECRIVAAMDSLPSPTELPDLMIDLRRSSPNAILIWGQRSDARYVGLVNNLGDRYPNSSTEVIIDPLLGEVGTAFFTTAN